MTVRHLFRKQWLDFWDSEGRIGENSPSSSSPFCIWSQETELPHGALELSAKRNSSGRWTVPRQRLAFRRMTAEDRPSPAGRPTGLWQSSRAFDVLEEGAEVISGSSSFLSSERRELLFPPRSSPVCPEHLAHLNVPCLTLFHSQDAVKSEQGRTDGHG